MVLSSLVLYLLFVVAESMLEAFLLFIYIFPYSLVCILNHKKTKEGGFHIYVSFMYQLFTYLSSFCNFTLLKLNISTISITYPDPHNS